MVATGKGSIAIRVCIMATAFNLVDYRTVEPVRRPRLRIVEPRAMAAVEPVQAPVVPAAPAASIVEAVTETLPSQDRKPAPPSWMIAPPFQGDPVLNIHQSWAAHRPAPAASVPSVEGPYRSIREVPRAGW